MGELGSEVSGNNLEKNINFKSDESKDKFPESLADLEVMLRTIEDMIKDSEAIKEHGLPILLARKEELKSQIASFEKKAA